VKINSDESRSFDGLLALLHFARSLHILLATVLLNSFARRVCGAIFNECFCSATSSICCATPASIADAALAHAPGALGLFSVSVVDSSVIPLPLPGSTDLLFAVAGVAWRQSVAAGPLCHCRQHPGRIYHLADWP